MNPPAIQQLFKECLPVVDGDKAAAANLVLAAALREHLPMTLAEVTEPSDRPAVRTDTPLTVPEVAKFLRVSPDKVLSWIRSGRLSGYNVADLENGRPKYRVNPEDLQAFMQRRAITQPVPKGRPVGRRRIPQPEWRPR
jgi:excisionase family DNA binding protein